MFRSLRKRASATLRLHDADVRIFGMPYQSSLEASITENKPSKILLQLCETRLKRIKQAPIKAETVPQIDAVARVHGGLTTPQVREALALADKLDIPVECVDVPIKTTANAVATRLLFAPTNVLGFLEFVLRGRASVGTKTEELQPGYREFENEYEKLLEARLPQLYNLLFTRRQAHMAHAIVSSQQAPTESLAVLCEECHVHPLRQKIADTPFIPTSQFEKENPLPRTIPLAGWIFVWAYILMPFYCATKVWGMLFRRAKKKFTDAMSKGNQIGDAIAGQNLATQS